MSDIYVIPDTQVRPGVKNPLEAVAYHIADTKPNYIVHLGDHWDMPSLSRYDKGKKSHRARTYRKDIIAGNEAMDEFFNILNLSWPENKKKAKKIFITGNHCHRITRAMEYGPDELIDLMEDFQPDLSGWDKVMPFLEPITIDGVTFSHYFQSNNSDRPIGTPRMLLNHRHGSCIAGHKQGFEYAEALANDKKRIQAIIAGSCYYHDESYKTHTNHHWRGVLILRDVKDGMFDFERISLRTLTRRYLK